MMPGAIQYLSAARPRVLDHGFAGRILEERTRRAYRRASTPNWCSAARREVRRWPKAQLTSMQARADPRLGHRRRHAVPPRRQSHCTDGAPLAYGSPELLVPAFLARGDRTSA